MEKKKAGIFDMDGVVVDTVPLHFEAWKQMFSEYGVDFNFEDYKKKVDGIPRMDGCRNILTDLNDEEIEKAAARKQGYFLKAIDKGEIVVYSSTVSLIYYLKDSGIKVAVISASKNCIEILTRIKIIDELDGVVDGHAITKGKPDPQVFLMAAEKLSVSPQDSVVFEDALLGVEAAKNAGMYCVGIDRYQDPARLKKADIIVNDVKELNEAKVKEIFSL